MSALAISLVSSGFRLRAPIELAAIQRLGSTCSAVHAMNQVEPEAKCGSIFTMLFLRLSGLRAAWRQSRGSPSPSGSRAIGRVGRRHIGAIVRTVITVARRDTSAWPSRAHDARDPALGIVGESDGFLSRCRSDPTCSQGRNWKSNTT